MHNDANFIPRRRMDPEVAGLISWWQTLHCAGRGPELSPRPPRDGERLRTLLGALTIGHVVQAFLAFRTELRPVESRDPRFRLLTRSQFAALEHLELQRCASGVEPAGRVRMIERHIGDLPAPRAFASFDFWGSAVAAPPRSTQAAVLNLTMRQRLAAEAIFFGLHEGIARRRGASHAEIVEVLEDDQAATLLRVATRMAATAAQSECPEKVPLFDTLVRELDLAGTQQADVAVSCALLRHEVKKLHELARGQFLRLLDERQRGTLDELEAGRA